MPCASCAYTLPSQSRTISGDSHAGSGQKFGVCSREYLIGRKQHTLGVKLRKDDDFSFLNVRIDICGAIWNAGCTLIMMRDESER